MGISKEELKKSINNYEGFGIVTPKMIPSLISRPLARELFDLMRDSGCEDMRMYEFVLENRKVDYYNVIYNTNLFSSNEEVSSYIVKGNW